MDKHVRQPLARLDRLKEQVNDFWNDKDKKVMGLSLQNEVELENIKRYIYERDLSITITNPKKYKDGSISINLYKL